jgi:hypothetical protein
MRSQGDASPLRSGIINSLIIMTTLIYKIPPNLPLPSGSEAALGRRLGRRPKGGIIPLFGKWFDETYHPELVEGEG